MNKRKKEVVCTSRLPGMQSYTMPRLAPGILAVRRVPGSAQSKEKGKGENLRYPTLLLRDRHVLAHSTLATE